jgi:hypothetical protein
VRYELVGGESYPLLERRLRARPEHARPGSSRYCTSVASSAGADSIRPGLRHVIYRPGVGRDGRRGRGGATGDTGATLRHLGTRAPALEVPGGGHGGRMRRRCNTGRRRPVAAAGCPLGPISPLTGPTWPRQCAASPSGARMELQGPASLPCPASGARPTADCEPTPTTRRTVPSCSRSWVSRSIRTRWRRPWPNGERTTWAQLFDLLSAWDAADGSHPAHQVARRAVRADRGPR